MRKIFIITPLATLAVLQLFPAPKNDTPPTKDDAIAYYKPPEEVATILREACYDCHSNQTRYPWYSRLQPVGWWLANHVDEAKSELNFSRFGALAPAKVAKLLEHSIDEIEGGEMPLDSYKWMHEKGRLTDKQVKAFSEWAESVIDATKTKDSAK